MMFWEIDEGTSFSEYFVSVSAKVGENSEAGDAHIRQVVSVTYRKPLTGLEPLYATVENDVFEGWGVSFK